MPAAAQEKPDRGMRSHNTKLAVSIFENRLRL